MGDKLDLLIPLNQDTMDRHLKLLGPGASVLYDGDSIEVGEAAEGVQVSALPMKELSKGNKLAANTVSIAAALYKLGIDFEALESALSQIFARKGDEVVAQNVEIAHNGYEYARENFTPFTFKTPDLEKHLAVWTGNESIAMGGIAAGMKFYAAYPMSPATGVLMYLATHARNLGIMVRQVEDEIGVMNMIIGAAHTGCRAMTATSGGGLALMTEAIGMSGIMETPIVCVDVQRGGPATGLPTKTEQGDLWQILGAGQGDFPKIIVAPFGQLDLFNTMPELFNLTDKYQCPGLVLSDLLISEGTASVDPADINFDVEIDRGKMIFPNGDTENPYGGYNDNSYLRYENTSSGISPRAVPGVPGKIFTATTDEHDEDGTVISDEFTNPKIRRMMVEKRARKMMSLVDDVEAPSLVGAEDAEVTLVGWGSTRGVILEAIEQLAAEGVTANQLPIKWIIPFHTDVITEILQQCKKVIIVEINYSGQFARYLRAETGFTADGFIRKYDGEPFMPHHIAEATKDQLAGKETLSVPEHEIYV